MFRLDEIYNQAIRISRNIVEDIRFGRQLYFRPIESFSVQMCKLLEEEKDILTFLNGVQDKYPHLHSHQANVAFLSFVIGSWMNMDSIKLEKLVFAGLLHDMGKAKLKDSMLNKTDSLTEDEMERLKAHPVISYKILKNNGDFDPEVLQAVLFHHEKMDGTGYPLGLKEDKIHLFSRIIAIADYFDVITASKAYQKKVLPLKAVEEIQANSFNHLDPSICQIFVTNMIEYYNGRTIRLSNEQIGNIVNINPITVTQPLVLCNNEYHDLSVERDIEVVEIL